MPRITPEEAKEQIKNARIKQQPRKAKAADLQRIKTRLKALGYTVSDLGEGLTPGIELRKLTKQLKDRLKTPKAKAEKLKRRKLKPKAVGVVVGGMKDKVKMRRK
ncbi:MAG: hypothetical protein DRH15_11490 [Deltaproteobacteria bacterium]|nr:MAG: hypothetical protein DRH15_11490 [Deltaproteobacteria bacterium]